MEVFDRQEIVCESNRVGGAFKVAGIFGVQPIDASIYAFGGKVHELLQRIRQFRDLGWVG